MVIVRIKGGLGNQLFQLGLAKELSDNLNTIVKLDLFYFENQNNFIIKKIFHKKLEYRKFELHNNDFQKATLSEIFSFIHNPSTRKIFKYCYWILKFLPLTILYKLLNFKIKSENSVYLNNSFLEDDFIYDGYWQSKIFFSSGLHIHKQYFEKLCIINKIYNNHIALNNEIIIHVRKSDYKNFQKYTDLDHSYYLKCLKYFRSITSLNKIIICTDDILWCKQNLVNHLKGYNFYFSIDLFHEISDFELMCNSRYLIIANSTYSFWAAFLFSDKIVCGPEMWYRFDSFDISFPQWKYY